MNKIYTLFKDAADKEHVLVKEQGVPGHYIGREYQLDIEPSQKIRNHSREFSWGYAGSGPAQLALALLLDYCEDHQLPDARAERNYQAFKTEWIESAKNNDEITTADIKRFFDQITQPEPPKIMSRADQIAVKVKFQLGQFETVGLKVKRIVVGWKDMLEIRENTGPCDPPDYSPDERRFCGIPIIKTSDAKTGVAYEFE